MVAARGVVVGVKRLTPPARALCVVRALQSKRGYAWHTDAMNMEHFTVSTYFRVSGQGSSLFGDGFAVWLTTSNRYREGPLHGFSETFTGIGIVFDTFRNLESGHVHKDVAVIVNDGSGPYKLDDGVEPQGCDGDFRYHEGRDDFNVHARSGAAITLNVRAGCCVGGAAVHGECSGARRLTRLGCVGSQKDVLTIRLDSKGDGNWKECVQSYKIPIQGEWYRQLYLGVTASTGQLADNHDIIAMITAYVARRTSPRCIAGCKVTDSWCDWHIACCAARATPSPARSRTWCCRRCRLVARKWTLPLRQPSPRRMR